MMVDLDTMLPVLNNDEFKCESKYCAGVYTYQNVMYHAIQLDIYDAP